MQILYFVYFLYWLASLTSQLELLTSRAELAFWLVRITSRAELARYLNEPERAEPKRAKPARYPALWVGQPCFALPAPGEPQIQDTIIGDGVLKWYTYLRVCIMYQVSDSRHLSKRVVCLHFEVFTHDSQHLARLRTIQVTFCASKGACPQTYLQCIGGATGELYRVQYLHH